jgi:hypothetical protein
MTIKTKTLTVEAAFMPIQVFLTFDLVKPSSIKCNFSIRSITPQSIQVMNQVFSLWQSWVSQAAKGENPPLPPGWRVIDGAGEVVPSPTPNHTH